MLVVERAVAEEEEGEEPKGDKKPFPFPPKKEEKKEDKKEEKKEKKEKDDDKDEKKEDAGEEKAASIFMDGFSAFFDKLAEESPLDNILEKLRSRRG